MNDKSYHMYLKIVKLACRNVKNEFCLEHNITEKQNVQVRIKDKDGLVHMVAAIFKTPESAEVIFAERVRKRIVISTTETLLKDGEIDTAGIFIGSVLKSRKARICQKQLINYLMAERYLDAAWDYDKRTRKDDSVPNLEYAKGVLTDRYSLNFIGGFLFEGRPLMEPGILKGLREQAFDPAYSFMTEEQGMQMVERRYVKEFEARGDKFLTATPVSYEVQTIKDTKDPHEKSMIDVFIKKQKTSETDIIAQLYQSSFANMPLAKRRRRFVNLRSKNRDVVVCPESYLKNKRQFTQIEATTKHTYIMNYFDDNMPLGANRSSYYFDQEVWMYKYIWDTEGLVYEQAGNICLPDGSMIEIPDAMTAWEFFHRINTVYAALFGFTPEDVQGGDKWLIDSIRSAYTDEGSALYALTMIDERMHEITEQKKEGSDKW